jgi:hypothetical protein
MMRPAALLLLSLQLCAAPMAAQPPASVIVTTDIDNFWRAYDRIVATADTGAKRALLQRYFLEPGTAGLRAIMTARRYTADQYLAAIGRYPQFWTAIRPNTLRAASLGGQIERGIERLRQVYPRLRPAPVYFTIGVLRTGGTTLDGAVLIGSELALADPGTPTDEFPPGLAHLRPSFNTNPIGRVVQLNVHEYVHTQQRDHDYLLLYRTLYEGIAEYVSVRALDTVSASPAIAYGRANEARVRTAFARALLSPVGIDHWFYNSADNPFGIRDLGYYVGYAIAERYHSRARDKQQAVREMIELDYSDSAAVDRYVDASGYFGRSMAALRRAYEEGRPTVEAVEPMASGDGAVDPATTEITLTFSEPMDSRFTGFDLGPDSTATPLRIQRVVGFSADRRTATFVVALVPSTRYQVMVSPRFRTAEGVPIRPFLLEFSTRGSR